VAAARAVGAVKLGFELRDAFVGDERALYAIDTLGLVEVG
jgi:hypothetical protein